jgi:hypothetical protein
MTGPSRPLAHRAFGREVKKRFPLAIDSKVSIGNLRENAYEGIRFSSDYVFNLPVEKNESMF